MKIGKREVGHEKTTARDDNTTKRIVVCSPISSCKKIAWKFPRKGTDISISSIFQRLSKEFGLKVCKKTKADIRNEKDKVGVCQESSSLDF